LAKADPEFMAISLRYFNPVGAHPTGQIGEHSGVSPNNLMPYIENVAIGNQPKLMVFGNDYNTRDGTGERDYIHIMDLAEGHAAALNKLQIGHNIYNLGTGVGTTVLELRQAYVEASGAEIAFEITERRAGDVEILIADPARAN
jgi:UDP-glucose 4-epimerase